MIGLNPRWTAEGSGNTVMRSMAFAHGPWQAQEKWRSISFA